MAVFVKDNEYYLIFHSYIIIVKQSADLVNNYKNWSIQLCGSFTFAKQYRYFMFSKDQIKYTSTYPPSPHSQVNITYTLKGM